MSFHLRKESQSWLSPTHSTKDAQLVYETACAGGAAALRITFLAIQASGGQERPPQGYPGGQAGMGGGGDSLKLSHTLDRRSICSHILTCLPILSQALKLSGTSRHLVPGLWSPMA